jgi:hypothetical protein
MKKLILVLVLVSIVVTAAWFLLRQPPLPPEIAELLPKETLLLVSAPEIQRTTLRWQETALYQLASDPAVVSALQDTQTAFWEQPEWQEALGQLQLVRPARAFLSLVVNSEGGVVPLGGVFYLGNRTLLRTGLKRMRREISPDGEVKVETSQVDGVEIVTQKISGFSLHTAEAPGWILFSSDPQALADFARAARLGRRESSLADRPNFISVTSRLDSDPDLLVFADAENLIQDLLKSTRGLADPFSTSLAAWTVGTKAAGFSMSLEGPSIVEKTFLLSPNGIPPKPISQMILPQTGPDTMILFESNFSMEPKQIREWLSLLPGQAIPWANIDEDGERFAGYLDGSFGFFIDWAAGLSVPKLGMMVGLKSPKEADEFLQHWLSQSPSLATREEAGEMAFYYFGSPGTIAFVSPTAAIGEDRLFLALQKGDLLKLIEPGSDSETLLESPRFASFSGYYSSGVNSFGYIDLPGILSRAYSLVLPGLKMGGRMIPGIDDYVRLESLPPDAEFTRHLSPIVWSQQVFPDGTLYSSSGPVTINHLLMGLIGGGVAGTLSGR